MQIQLRTDNHIPARQDLAQHCESVLSSALARYGTRLTRVEVHFGDENSHKGGDDDIRCVLEARPAGHQPVAVRHNAPAVELALDGAVEKLERMLDSTFGRLDNHKPRGTHDGASNV